jgi:type IV secretory pathway TraG/TraD family ATPase VirD4
MTTPRSPGAAPAGVQIDVTVVEGVSLRREPPAGLVFDDELLSTHILFLGGIGTGKTNAMKQLVRMIRARNRPGDVFVIFDTKGDFQADFYRPGDAVISTNPAEDEGGVTWNLFRDLPDDPGHRGEEINEIATTIFSDDLDQAGENVFFAAAARDIFAGVVEAMADGAAVPGIDSTPPYSNKELRSALEISDDDLSELLSSQPNLAGTTRYLEGGEHVESILAFLQLTLRKSFSGVFREPGDFSVRDFVRRRGGRALFIEYDIAVGASLLPVYRVLIDTAIKEALGSGRRILRENGEVKDNFYFIFDEFALLPRLSHVSDGINFGRQLGLKFLVGTQNVSQVLRGYSDGLGDSILSGFGTLFAFRLFDEASRTLVRQRYGANRKKVSTTAALRHDGVRDTVVSGNVIEDWEMSRLPRGQCIASLPPPHEAPFNLEFREFKKA